MFGDLDVLARITIWIPIVLSLSVHEWAHAWAAWRLGDDTARLQGRLTLNPLSHIDPVGTVLLPLLGVPFGWARPVPIEPVRFHQGVRMGTGVLLAAAAGPASNFLIALIATLALGLWAHFDPASVASESRGIIELVILLNLALALFNLLPIPPLDGSRIADAGMPLRWRGAWDAFASVGPLALVAVIVLPLFLGFSLIQAPLEGLRGLLTGSSGG